VDQVRVQSDPVGRLVITGQPEQLDNPWGITPFKKVLFFFSQKNNNFKRREVLLLYNL
jgi:hypothetical protein